MRLKLLVVCTQCRLWRVWVTCNLDIATGRRRKVVARKIYLCTVCFHSLWNNKKHLKNVGPIRDCELPHAHSAVVATGTVARRLRIDVHDTNDNDNAWQRGPLWPHGMGPITVCYSGQCHWSFGSWYLMVPSAQARPYHALHSTTYIHQWSFSVCNESSQHNCPNLQIKF